LIDNAKYQQFHMKIGDKIGRGTPLP